jgi:YD repeat-containing protein
METTLDFVKKCQGYKPAINFLERNKVTVFDDNFDGLYDVMMSADRFSQRREFNSFFNMVKTTHLDGTWNKMYLDNSDRLIKMVTDDGNSYETTYDLNGNLIHYKTSNGYWYKQKFDGNNRVHYEDKNGDSEVCTFDKYGNEITICDSGGLYVTKRYNDKNNIVRRSSNQSGDTTYLYNVDDQLISVSGNKSYYKYDYNDNGDIVYIDHDGSITLNDYDSYHNVIYHEDCHHKFAREFRRHNNGIEIFKDNKFEFRMYYKVKEDMPSFS